MNAVGTQRIEFNEATMTVEASNTLGAGVEYHGHVGGRAARAAFDASGALLSVDLFPSCRQGWTLKGGE